MRLTNLLTALVIVVTPAVAAADVIDFELALPEGTVLSNEYANVSFAGGRLVVPGLPATGFSGNSSGIGAGGEDDANSGQTLTSTSPTTDPIVITFDSAVRGAGLDLVDIEGYGGGDGESATISVFDVPSGGTPIYTVTVSDVGQPLGYGDGALTHVDLSGFTGDTAIRRIEASRSFGEWGWAIDNVAYSFDPTSTNPETWGQVKSRFSN